MSQTPGSPADHSKEKAAKFFDRADQVAESGNWDFAIQMYLEGIVRDPENIERGHKPLWDAGMQRKMKGGKPAGLMEQLKHKPSKEPLTSLTNAEFLLAKDPGSLSHMDQVRVAAAKAQLPVVTKWICDIMLDVMRQAQKPSKKILAELIQAYADLEEFALASQACQMALKIAPNDGPLQNIMRDLAAKYTMKKGQFDKEGDFTKGIRDKDKQKELIQKDQLQQDKSFLEQQAEKARQEYIANPRIPGKINALVDLLVKTEDEAFENEAIDVLAKAHKDVGSYQFKMKMGEIKIAQKKRQYSKYMIAGDKASAAKVAQEILVIELQEYKERAENYPTDMSIKYELGRRLFLTKNFDEAIPAFQQATRDARRHVPALNYLGMAFREKGLLHEAAETFEKAIQSELTEDRAKEIRYNLGDVMEKLGQLEKAQEQFSAVAQLDYNYRDVRQRLEAVRKMIAGKA